MKHQDHTTSTAAGASNLAKPTKPAAPLLEAKLELYRLAYRILLSAQELGYNASTDRHAAAALLETKTVIELFQTEIITKVN